MEEKITKDEMIQRTGKALLKFLEDVGSFESKSIWFCHSKVLLS